MQAPGTIRRFGDLNRQPVKDRQDFRLAGTNLWLLPLTNPTKIPQNKNKSMNFPIF